jgi:hypothetical protein
VIIAGTQSINVASPESVRTRLHTSGATKQQIDHAGAERLASRADVLGAGQKPDLW